MFYKSRRLLPYIVLVISALLVVLFTLYISPIVGKTTAFLFYIFIITVTSWLCGLVYALSVMAFILALNTTALVLQSEPLSIYESLMFVISSSMVGYVVEIFRKTDLITEFKKKREIFDTRVLYLEQVNANLQKEIRLRDEFLSIASHELKTPLTSMLLKIQVALHSVRNVSLAKFSVQNLLAMLETAEQQVQRLGKMINDLVNTSLITTGKLDLEIQQADLTALVREVVGEFIEKLDREGYKLTLKAEKPIPVFIDKVRIEQVVTNLLTNAIKYGNKKPIEVEVVNGHQTAKVIVKDRGLGVDPKHKDQIFGLFERGVLDKTYKGLGVGLFISNHIVKAHNGRITVDTKLNRGSTFTVELPIERTN